MNYQIISVDSQTELITYFVSQPNGEIIKLSKADKEKLEALGNTFE